MKYNFKDVTFIIALTIDTYDRLDNINITVRYLLKNLITNIIIVESGHKSYKDEFKFDLNNVNYYFLKDNTEIFYRSKLFNFALKHVNTPITVLYDADIILPLNSYLTARHKIINECYDLFLPFSNKLYNINEKDKFSKTLDLKDMVYFDYGLCGCGGCCFLSTEAYKFFGGENEEIVGWGPDDVERIWRMYQFGFKISSVQKIVYQKLNSDNELNRFGYISTELNSRKETYPMFHLSHGRSKQIEKTNINNWIFFNKIIELPYEKLKFYYFNRANYLKKNLFNINEDITIKNYEEYKEWLRKYLNEKMLNKKMIKFL